MVISHLGAPSCAGTRARLRAKQGLLATLVERCRDGNAYTRARTLQTWAALAEASAIPLGHWVCITQLAAGAPQPPKATSASTRDVVREMLARHSSVSWTCARHRVCRGGPV